MAHREGVRLLKSARFDRRGRGIPASVDALRAQLCDFVERYI